MEFSSKLKLGDKVSIDGGSVVGRVTAFYFASHHSQLMVSWWNNGALIEQWISEWRLAPAEEVGA